MTWKRVATAAVLIPIVVALVLFASTGVVAIALSAVIVLALFEYFSLGDAIGHRAYRLWTVACALLLVWAQWAIVIQRAYLSPGGLSLNQQIGRFVQGIGTFQAVLFLFVLGIAALTLWTRRPVVEALPAAGVSASALLMVAFPLTFAVRLHGLATIGPRLLLFALMIIWVSDTTAYFVGRAIGKHPFAPDLSPKKTWEGAIAGLFGSLLVAVIFARWLPATLLQLLIAAGLGNVAGQIGDLLESAYKRSAGVKDSGGLLPGHGGILDRIDALILALPVVWYYWVLIGSPGN
jgi:phosphatidate cytidylyltransferase